MKKMSFLAGLLLLVASTTVAMAGPSGKGTGMGPGRGMNDSVLSGLDLTAEQSEEVCALRESHRKEITPFRTQLLHKRAELRLLWMQTDLDHDSIRAKQKELHGLTWQIQEKTTDYLLAFRRLLTPEQVSKFLAQGQGRGHGYGPGRGLYGQGMGLDGSR
jgi:Spy/CpxP family protein refolding chaperone